MKPEQADGTTVAGWLASGCAALRITSPLQREVIRLSLLDTLGVALAAQDDPLVLATRSLATHAHGTVRIWGAPEASGLEQAVLANAVAAHVLDYDDVSDAMGGHPSAVLWPCLLGLSDLSAGEPELESAYACGHWVAAALGSASAALSRNGFHPTAIIGAIACAAAGARLLRLGHSETMSAIGMAAAQTGGLLSAFGTPAKSLQCARAAVVGASAARLAAQGVTAREDSLEGPHGLFAALAGPAPVDPGVPAPAVLTSNLFKFHAACYWSHSAIEAALQLAREHALHPERIAGIEVAVSAQARAACRIDAPTTETQAKFSIAHVVALALNDMDTGRPDAYALGLQDTRVASLRGRVRLKTAQAPSPTLTTVTITTADGDVYRAEFDAVRAAAEPEQVALRVQKKFLALTGDRIGADAAAALLRRVTDPDQPLHLMPLPTKETK
jgi:2-methylcitrate dehydratase PrpD